MQRKHVVITHREGIKPALIIDMDGVSVQFVPAICKEYNKTTNNGELTPADITAWDMRQFGIEDEMWIKPGFFRNLEPMPGAVEVLYKLKNDYRITIATDCMGVDFIQKDKQAWINEHLPFVDDVYFLSDKSIVPGDLLFDDAPHHLDNWPGIKVKMVTPYNQDTKADYEVNNWQEFDELIRMGLL